VRTRRSLIAVTAGLVVALVGVVPTRAEVDTGVIRLAAPSSDDESRLRDPSGSVPEGRRGFDYEGFESRFESYWFRRKALLTEGRDDDAHRQSELIRSFCAEEEVKRLDTVAGALVAEARRYSQEGSYEKALASLDLAETFDPGRSQIHFARASILQHSGDGYVAALRELLMGIRRSLVEGWTHWTLLNHGIIVAVFALLAAVGVFGVVMAYKYQLPFRHEVEEALSRAGAERWGPAAGWCVLLLPLVSWLFTGWLVLYWIVATFRFMRRSERLAAVVLLLATALAAPAFRVGVGVYGMTTDPAVRTTLESASGVYSPDRLVRLKELVDSHPDDPVYRFLLAGLYKDGRYFEEAYEQYRRVLQMDPSKYQAHINLGNIYYRLGQHGEAVAEYRKALEGRPDSVLAYYDMYLAQSESFRFRDAEESLRKAQTLDPELATRLLSRATGGEHQSVVDASVHIGSVWRAALEGRPLRDTIEHEDSGGGFLRPLPTQLLNGLSLLALASLAACGVLMVVRRGRPARRCIRCGRPFCHRCRSGREGHEYCSQCLHLFVIGDGLAPETKTKKLYEVERFEAGVRRGRRLLSMLVPGSAHLLRGVGVRGCVLVFLWALAILTWAPGVLGPADRLLGLHLDLGMLRGAAVPDAFAVDPSTTLAMVGAVAVWIAGNGWLWRRREA
jgi:tetratricopeptide (TPR) repeat protein